MTYYAENPRKDSLNEKCARGTFNFCISSDPDI